MASIRTYLVSSAAHDFRSSLEKWIQGLRPYLIALFDFLISNLVSSLYILDVDPDPGVCLANALPALRVTCAAPGTTLWRAEAPQLHEVPVVHSGVCYLCAWCPSSLSCHAGQAIVAKTHVPDSRPCFLLGVSWLRVPCRSLIDPNTLQYEVRHVILPSRQVAQLGWGGSG